jgi:hypothetical protein
MAAASSLMLSACSLIDTALIPAVPQVDPLEGVLGESVLFEGTFDAKHIRSPFNVSDNTVTLRVYPGQDPNVINGVGTLVVTKSAAFEGDPEWTETSVLHLTGTYDEDRELYRGLVTITGGQTCVSICEGMDMAEWDYAADWTGQLWHLDTVIVGKADFGAFDFTAKVVGDS